MEITLDEAKKYLRQDSHDEDNLITSIILAATQMCKDVMRGDDTTLSDNEAISRIAILYAIGYLYEHREEADHKELELTLRALFFAIRKAAF